MQEQRRLLQRPPVEPSLVQAEAHFCPLRHTPWNVLLRASHGFDSTGPIPKSHIKMNPSNYIQNIIVLEHIHNLTKKTIHRCC